MIGVNERVLQKHVSILSTALVTLTRGANHLEIWDYHSR